MEIRNCPECGVRVGFGDDGICPSCRAGTAWTPTGEGSPSNDQTKPALSFKKCCQQDYLYLGGFLFPAVLWISLVLNSMGIYTRTIRFFEGQTLLNGLLICTAATVIGLACSWWRWHELARLYNQGVRVEALITALRENCITVEYEFDNRKYKKSRTPGNAAAYSNRSTTEIIVDPKRPGRIMLVE